MFRLYDSNYAAMNPILEEGPNILWLGDCTAAYDRATLDAKGIKTVLTVATGLNVSYPEGGINHKVYNLLDIESSNIARFFPDSYNQITEGLKKASVLVHCAAGVSRSASVVIAYVMRTKGLTFQEAYNFVKRKRGVIFPNYGFQRQLKNFEKELKEQKKHIDHQLQDEQFKKTASKQLFKEESKQQYQQQQQQYTFELSTKPLLKPIQKLEEQVIVKTPTKTPNKDHRQVTQFNKTEQQKKVSTAYSGRANSTQPKFLLTSSYNASYVGPQIVTHQKNKMYDKSEKKPLNMPGINVKQQQQYHGYKKI